MPTTCCVMGCFNNNRRDKERGIKRSYYCIPTPKTNQSAIVQRVTEARRRQWLRAIYRKDLNFKRDTRQFRVCSDHFISGKPAYEMAETDPDWAPTLKLGHKYAKQPSKRCLRLLEKKRKARAAQNNEDDEETEDADEIAGMETGEFKSGEHFVTCEGPTEDFPPHTWPKDHFSSNQKLSRPSEKKRKTTCGDTGGQSVTGYQPSSQHISPAANQAPAVIQLSASTLLSGIAQLTTFGQLSAKTRGSVSTLPSVIDSSSAFTQPSRLDHDYFTKWSSSGDRLQDAGKQTTELEDLPVGEKATRSSWKGLQDGPTSEVSLQTGLHTGRPHLKSVDQRPEELQLLKASESSGVANYGSLDPQPSLPACGPFPVMLIGPQEKKLLSQLYPMETRSSEEGVCQSSVQPNLREELAVPAVVVKTEPCEDNGDAPGFVEEVVIKAEQEDAALPVEVKMEPVEEDCVERNMCRTQQDFAVLPLEVKMEPDMGYLDSFVQVKTEPPDS